MIRAIFEKYRAMRWRRFRELNKARIINLHVREADDFSQFGFDGFRVGMCFGIGIYHCVFKLVDGYRNYYRPVGMFRTIEGAVNAMKREMERATSGK